MEPIEMIEKVCESANVSFEEARQVLEENNWNVEAALNCLEAQGKKVQHTQAAVEEEVQMEVIDFKDYKETKQESTSTQVKGLLRKVFDYLRTNSIRIEKDGTEIITMKLILFLILLAIAGEIVLVLMVLGLFFKFNYSVVGRNKNEEVNNLMNGASRVAQAAAQGFKTAWNEK
ncbi:MAG: hypothetical protein KBT48_04690 [Firmicutes bacterium]|nr:hypothetical protein [Bacillota bacterium]